MFLLKYTKVKADSGRLVKKKLGFSCLHCGTWVGFNDRLSGTHFRNHCSFCLWSKHLGQGRVKVNCGGAMEPIGLTFKQEGWDKKGNLKQGELMLINKCQKCSEITINRLAGDDDPQVVFNLFQKSFELSSEEKEKIKTSGIYLVEEKDKEEVKNQLFGKY